MSKDLNFEIEINKDEFKKKLDIKDGQNGRDGVDAVNGRDGADGKDGSPDTPDEVVEKVNISTKKIKSKQVEGLSSLIQAVDDIGKNPIGGGANPLIIKNAGQRVSEHVTELDFSTGLLAQYSNNGKVTLTSAGTGDVVGPSSSTDNAIARYDGVTGKLIQNSALTITDAGDLIYPSSGTTNTRNFYIQDQTALNQYGEGLFIGAGGANGEGYGGELYLSAGFGSAIGSGNGGELTIQSGAGGQVDGVGGDVNLTTGRGYGSGGGGNFNLNVGITGATGNGGSFFATSGGGGNTSGNGGDVGFAGGGASTGNGGAAFLSGGSVSTQGNGGDVFISAGDKAGSGTQGKLKIRSGGSTQYAVLDTATIATTDKTFTFPNTSGTLALTSSTLTTGSIPFANSSGVLTEDNTNLFWDNTNKTLTLAGSSGIGGLVAHTISIPSRTTGNSTILNITADSQAMFLEPVWRIGIGSATSMGIRSNGVAQFSSGIACGASGDFNINSFYIRRGNTSQIFFGGGGEPIATINSDIAGVGFSTNLLLPTSSASTIGLIVRGTASQTANLQEWQNSAGTVLTSITSAGNVGIGAASPTYSLDVQSVAGNGGIVGSIQTTGVGNDAFFQIKATGQTGGLFYQRAATGRAGFTGNVAFTVEKWGGTTPVFFVDTSTAGTGNVGIGITNPGEKLDINGNIRLIATGNAVGSGTKIDWYRAADGWNAAQIEQSFGGTGYEGTLSFKTNTGASLGDLSTKMTILASGNVGIGTPSPSTKLDVVGAIKSNAYVTINLNGSDSIGAGPFYQLVNAAGTEASAFQLSASNNVDLWQYNGAWARTVTFKKDGNVGIGITNPGFKLEVADQTRITGAVYPRISFNASGNAVNSKKWQFYVDPTGSFLFNSLNDAENSETNILTLNRNNTVNVSGTIFITATAGATPLYITGGTAVNEIWQGTIGTANQGAAFGQSIPGNAANGDMVFSVYNSTWVEGLRIKNSNANVGIGLSPTAALHIKAGTATANTAPLKFTMAGSVVLTTPETGVMETSTDNVYLTKKTAIRESIPGVIFTSTADATVANTITETSVIGSGVGTKTLPANFLVAGKTLSLRVRGIMTDTGTPTLNIKFKLGSTTIVETTAIALSGTITNNYWETDVHLTCRTTGATGTVIASGEFTFDTTNQTGKVEGMSQTVASTIDTTASQVIDVTATWGTASASNTITGQISEIEVIN